MRRHRFLAPGFIDLHVHVTGGGGEDGFSSRSPESRLTDFSTAGVTTLVGLLGTDGVARSLEALYAKVCALTEEGVDCRMLTGAYGYPSPTLCGSVERDLVLIDRVIGAKLPFPTIAVPKSLMKNCCAWPRQCAGAACWAARPGC